MIEERLLAIDVEVLNASDGFREILDDRSHGDAARELSADGSADAVRDDEDVHFRLSQPVEDRRVLQIRSAKLHGLLQRHDREVIFVRGADLSGVRQPKARRRGRMRGERFSFHGEPAAGLSASVAALSVAVASQRNASSTPSPVFALVVSAWKPPAMSFAVSAADNVH